jgi:glycosyltransferase involved in cell wall biosynthesis
VPFTVHIDGHKGWGGGQEQSLGLALALAARGERVAFIAHPGGALASRLDGSYLDWQALPLRGIAGLAAVPRLARCLRRQAPDIVHIHDSASHAPAALAARLADVPRVIVTRRTHFPLRPGPLGRAKFHLWCDRVICVSEAVRRRCLDAGLPPGKLAVLPDFVDCRRFDPDAVPARDTGPGQTILTLGRLAPEKGHRVLLRAIPEVRKRAPHARLTICGEGEERRPLEAQAAALGLGGAVEFLGFVRDVRPVLAAAAVVAMPSLSEGLGVAALEAMAMAKPVVASDTGGLPESIVHGETGLLVPPGDPAALAQALAQLLADPGRAEAMGRAGRSRALEHFDRARIVDRLLALYDEALQGAAL